MKKALLIGTIMILIIPQLSWGQIPQTMSYQGVITDAGGVAVNGNVDLTFRLWDAASSGTELWRETQSGTAVSNGIINVILGSVTPLTIPFDNQYWLGITVGTDPELTPRVQLTSSPYSLSAQSGGAGNSLDAADGSPADALFVDNRGNVGIGTSNPGAKLEVTGQVKITGGTPGADKVLTSDAAGLATWQTPSTGAASIDDLSDGSTSGGFGNLFLGSSAGAAIESGGNQNTGMGRNALKSTTTGDGNTASGYGALTSNTTGSNNTASGSVALLSNTTGTFNTASGNGALLSNTIANYNTAVGASALLRTNRTADVNAYNTAVGFNAGDIITTGQKNVMIGARSNPSASSAINQIVIGYGVTGTGDNEIALGNTSITAIKGQVSFTTYSDRRIKRDIQDGDLGLAFINELRPVKYKLKNPADYPELLLEERFSSGKDERPEEDNTVYDGLIAQEVKSSLEKLGVSWSGWSEDDNTAKQGIQYGALVVPLIKALQELSARVEELEGQRVHLGETDAGLTANKGTVQLLSSN